MKTFSYMNIIEVIIQHLEALDNILKCNTLSSDKKSFYEGAKCALLYLAKSLIDRKEVD